MADTETSESTPTGDEATAPKSKFKLIAIVVDGNVIFAPLIRSEINDSAQITGNDPSGLTAVVVDRIVASINRK